MNSTSFTVRITLRRFCLRAKMKTIKSTLSVSLQSFNITNHFNHAGNKVNRVRLLKTLLIAIKRCWKVRLWLRQNKNQAKRSQVLDRTSTWQMQQLFNRLWLICLIRSITRKKQRSQHSQRLLESDLMSATAAVRWRQCFKDSLTRWLKTLGTYPEAWKHFLSTSKRLAILLSSRSE